MQSKLAEYVQNKYKDNKGIARLGFSSERELFNIFSKIFSEKRKLQTDFISRRIMLALWEAFQKFRFVQKEKPKDIKNPQAVLESYKAH
jgi:hypothetical protein